MTIFSGQGRPRPSSAKRFPLLRDRRAGTALLVAMMFPVFFGIAVLGADVGRLYYMKLKVNQATQSAALAAGFKLTDYYTTTNQTSTGTPASVSAAAVSIAASNTPAGAFGNVVTAANVEVGTWNNSTNTYAALSGTGPFAPNAVKITGLATAANGNAITTFFGSLLGKASIDVSSTSIATFGTPKPFNVIVVNDLSSSFSSNLGNQQAADVSILNCVAYGNTSGQFGMVRFNGDAAEIQTLTNASLNKAAITTTINATQNCSTTGTCSGSNVAAGIYLATKRYEAYFKNVSIGSLSNDETTWTTHAPTTTVNNIVVITDGQPNAASFTYRLQDGVTTNGTSALCTTSCTSAQLNSAAVYQARTIAQNLGIQVSTIYYTEAGANAAADSAFLQSLLTPLGKFMSTPTSGSIATYAGGVCTLMGSKLVM